MSVRLLLLPYRLMRLYIIISQMLKLRKNVMEPVHLLLFLKVAGTLTAPDIQELLCHIQILFIFCQTVKLNKCQLHLRMPGTSVDLSFIRAKGITDKVCQSAYDL